MPLSSEELQAYMSRLSGRHFHVPWVNGWEYILWRWLHSPSPLSQVEQFTLFNYHNRAKGWFIMVDEELRFVTTDKWIWMFADEFEGVDLD